MKLKFLFLILSLTLIISLAGDTSADYEYEYQYQFEYSAPEYSAPEYSAPEYGGSELPLYGGGEKTYSYQYPAPYGTPYLTPNYGSGEGYAYPTPGGLIPPGGYECKTSAQCQPNKGGEATCCNPPEGSQSRMCASTGGGPYCYSYEYQTPYTTPPDEYPTPEYPTPADGFPLTVTKAGTGSGTVTSSPGGINCGSTCTANFAQDSIVTLTMVPASGSTFTGWSGACSGTGSCVLLMNQVRNVTASFIIPNILTTTIDSGSGTLTAPGISCPGDCSESYDSGTWVTLTATPAAGFTFNSWTGYCVGAGNPCSVLMNASQDVGANFVVLAPFNYSLSNSGNVTVPKASGNAFGQNIITKTLLAGISQSVSLALSGVPSGVSYSITNGTCSPSCASTITLTVSPATAIGTYLITVTGSPLSKQTTFNLVVTAPSAGTLAVICTATPNPILLRQVVTWTGTISGGTTPYTYSWSGPGIPTSPAPNTNPMSIAYTTIGPKYAILTVTDSLGAFGACVFGGGSGSSALLDVSFDPEFEEF